MQQYSAIVMRSSPALRIIFEPSGRPFRANWSRTRLAKPLYRRFKVSGIISLRAQYRREVSMFLEKSPRHLKMLHSAHLKQPVCTMTAACILLTFYCVHVPAETPLVVKDPNASFLDVAARRQALQTAQNPLLHEAIANLKGCVGTPFPAPPPHGQDIPSRYMSGSHGALNPLEHQLSEPYYKIQDIAAQGADKYLATGDPAEANCVIQAILQWVNDKAALLDYSAKDDEVVWFQSTWTVASLSLSVSIIRSEPALNAADRDRVIAWLRDAAHKSFSETRGPTSGTNTNNHFFWRGLAATAAGVISGDNKLFSDGLRTYSTAIGEIHSQGAFPDEMARHELAMHYQAFAIEPLVMIAELAYRQGLNIYPLEQHGHRLSDAVNFLNRAIADPSIIKKYTPEAQKLDPDFQPGSALLSWAELWTARTGDTAWQRYIDKPFFDSRLAGSTTLFAAPVQAAPAAPPAGTKPPPAETTPPPSSK
jgi:poly(beta-D-mannuronate) lyase